VILEGKVEGNVARALNARTATERKRIWGVNGLHGRWVYCIYVEGNFGGDAWRGAYTASVCHFLQSLQKRTGLCQKP